MEVFEGVEFDEGGSGVGWVGEGYVEGVFWGEEVRDGCGLDDLGVCLCRRLFVVGCAGHVDRAGFFVATSRLVHVASLYVAVHTRGACDKSWISPLPRLGSVWCIHTLCIQGILVVLS